ncbi:MAG: ferrous iron transport protein B [Deltaproteobacteria bacterium]|nr:ferrous iron transport protein B [Deltaproteobacteria bacterium]
MKKKGGKEILIALAGNPNTGKTTVFNQLTGSRQHVGNWPGVTVEKKEGEFTFQGARVRVVDLPGTYGLTAYSIDEKIARDFLVKERPDLVVAIVDATNLERNLYLVTQLLELKVNLIICLNMLDLAEKRGWEIDIQTVSDVVRAPVVPTVANKGQGIEDLKKTILSTATRTDNKFKIDYGRDTETMIEEVEEEIRSLEDFPYPPRWSTIKFLEGDPDVLKLLYRKGIDEGKLNRFLLKVQRDLGYDDLETLIAERRYGYIHGLCKECIKKRADIEERINWSDQIDKVLTNKYLGIPIFLAFMVMTFQIVFGLGGPLADLIDAFFGWLGSGTTSLLQPLGAPPWIISLLSDGIIAGVGSVLVFLPHILLLFLAIAILEDSGYMARAAFVMDRLMHALGLHGKSFIPMIIGFGCNIPAIMATRTLESKKDRILTILVNPLMSCSARLPIYTLFAGAFFAQRQGLVVFSLYLLGIVLATIMARIFKAIFFREEVAPLIMELPPYRLPSLKGVILHMWERGSLFVRKAGTIIFAGVVLIWLLASLPPGVEYGSQGSLIGRLGSIFAPLLKPAGFGFWQAAVALLFGIVAKEVVVGTLGTLYGVEGEGLREVLPQYFVPLSAYAFMTMSLIYIPCIAAIATIKRETNWRWTLLAVSYSLILGWILAVLIYQIGRVF